MKNYINNISDIPTNMICQKDQWQVNENALDSSGWCNAIKEIKTCRSCQYCEDRFKEKKKMKRLEDRPKLDDYFLQITEVVAKRSTCIRHDVGSVIVKDKHIISTGYNGAPKGTKHCYELGCIRDIEAIPSGTMHEKCRAVHSEQNAIIQAGLHGISTEGGTIYCTHQPCIICAKMIINAGIVKIVYKKSYPDTHSLEILKEAGVEVISEEKLKKDPCRECNWGCSGFCNDNP